MIGKMIVILILSFMIIALAFAGDAAQFETQKSYCKMKYGSEWRFYFDWNQHDYLCTDGEQSIEFFGNTDVNKYCKEEFWKFNDCK